MPTIALVDDENSIRTSVSLALETDGFQVDAFNNGVEALEALESKHYDLGLFDIKMPKMDGNELLSKVRNSKIETLKNMPVIFLTSKDQEQDEIIGLRMGAADYITKPFSQKLLNERIKTVLRIYQNRSIWRYSRELPRRAKQWDSSSSKWHLRGWTARRRRSVTRCSCRASRR